MSSGYGVWKSVDAGKTWKSSGLPNSRHIPRIVIDPKNSDIVYAAVLGNIYKPTSDRGVYKSIDGGENWEKILFSNELSLILYLFFFRTIAAVIAVEAFSI